jgi:hypothetical protein
MSGYFQYKRIRSVFQGNQSLLDFSFQTPFFLFEQENGKRTNIKIMINNLGKHSTSLETETLMLPNLCVLE